MIIKREPLDAARIRHELDEYERRYATPSDRLLTAFTVDGALRETDDFRRWLMLFTAWKRTHAVSPT